MLYTKLSILISDDTHYPTMTKINEVFSYRLD